MFFGCFPKQCLSKPYYKWANWIVEVESNLSAAITVDIVRILSNDDTRLGLLSIVTLLLNELSPLSEDSSNFRPPVSIGIRKWITVTLECHIYRNDYYSTNILPLASDETQGTSDYFWLLSKCEQFFKGSLLNLHETATLRAQAIRSYHMNPNMFMHVYPTTIKFI